MDFQQSLEAQAKEDAKIASGESTYPIGQEIPMKMGDDGKVFMVPSDQVKNAISQGYRTATPNEVSLYDNVKSEGNLGGLEVAAKNIVNMYTAGVSGAIERNTNSEEENLLNREREKQNPFADAVGLGLGVASTFATGPVSMLVKGGEKLATGLGIGTIARALPEGNATGRIAESMATNGLGNVLKSSVPRIAKKSLESGARGAVIGTAIAAPAASIDAMFGNTKEAGEQFLIGAGLGFAGDLLIGGAIEGIKTIPEISQVIRKSTNNLISKIYGVGSKETESILSGSIDEAGNEIAASMKERHIQDVNRMAATMNDIGQPVENLPAEAVIQSPTGKANAQKIAKNQIKFGENKTIIEQAKDIEDAAGNKVKGVINEKIGQTGIEPSELSGMSAEQIAVEAANGIKKKLNLEIDPITNEWNKIDETIANVKTPNSAESREDELRLLLRESSPIYGDKYKGTIQLAKLGRTEQLKAIRSLGYDVLDGEIVRIGEGALSKVEREIAIQKQKAISSILKKEEGELVPSSKRKQLASALESVQTGAGLKKLEFSIRNERGAAWRSGDRNLYDLYDNALDAVHDLKESMFKVVGGEGSGKYLEELNKKYSEFMDKYSDAIKFAYNKRPKSASHMKEIINDPSNDKRLLNLFDSRESEFYKNKVLTKVFDREVNLSAAYKIQKMVDKHTDGENFNVRGFISDVKKLSDNQKEQMFGVKGKSLVENLEHLFSHMKTSTKAQANDASGSLVSALLGRHTVAGGLAGAVVGHGIAGAIVGGALRTGANIFKVAKLNAEKNAILESALGVEKQYQVKNATKAVMKVEKMHDKVDKWAKETFQSNKNFSLSRLSLLANEDQSKKMSLEEEYKKNIEAAKKIVANKDDVIKTASEHSNAFSPMSAAYLEYLNSANQALQALDGAVIGHGIKKKDSFFVLPDIKPSKNQMIQFNNQMKSFKNPFKIVEDLSSGIINQETMKIASIVFPATTERIKKTISDNLFSSEKIKISFQDRLKLGLFLGTDLDGSMEHLSIYNQQAQNSHNQELNQQVKQLKLSGNIRSPAQSIGEV
jgi:hypothetical protein